MIGGINVWISFKAFKKRYWEDRRFGVLFFIPEVAFSLLLTVC
jgi:hypothetical protein